MYTEKSNPRMHCNELNGEKKKSTQDCGEDVVYVECSKPFTYEVPFKLSRSLRRQPKSDFMSSHLHMIE